VTISARITNRAGPFVVKEIILPGGVQLNQIAVLEERRVASCPQGT